MRRYVLLFLTIFFISSTIIPDLEGLKPGLSTKGEVDRVLGPPIREVIRGVRYDYDPTEYNAHRISIKFYEGIQIIESIDFYFRETYRKSRYKKWFDLGKPVMTAFDSEGNLVEYYQPSEISLHYEGPHDSYDVAFFSLFDPSSIEKSEPNFAQIVSSLSPAYYVKSAIEAYKKKDCESMKKNIDEGLQLFPDNAEIWTQRTRYYIGLRCEPVGIRKEEMKRSALKAYELNPSDKNTINLGWVYQVLDDCHSALYYYSKADERYAKEDSSLHYHMAKCFEKINDKENAKYYYHRFLEAAPDHKYASDAIKKLDALRRRR